VLTATELVYAVYAPAKLILSSMPKQQKAHQLADTKENCCESGAKYDVSIPSYLVLAALRVQTHKIQKEI